MSTQSKAHKVPASDQAWENGELGRDEAYVKVSTQSTEQGINDALELQLISIRLQKGLIEDLKMIAELNGLGYQPLIRQILTRFADAEKKRLLQNTVKQVREGHEVDLGEMTDELSLKQA